MFRVSEFCRLMTKDGGYSKVESWTGGRGVYMLPSDVRVAGGEWGFLLFYFGLGLGPGLITVYCVAASGINTPYPNQV